MSSRQEASRRLILPSLISLGVALLFCLQLLHSTFLAFPRQIIVLKGDRGSRTPGVQAGFEVKKGAAGNTWVLEAEFFQRIDGQPDVGVSLNQTALPQARIRGKTLWVEFPARLLREGSNVLEVRVAEDIAYRRLRIKNIYGYSRGLISAVVFYHSNVYPEARLWPKAFLENMFLALFFILSFALNFLPAWARSFPRSLLRNWRMARYLIPVFFLVLIILPIVSKFRVWLELRTVLILVFLFYALIYSSWLEVFISKFQGSAASLRRFWVEPAAKRERSDLPSRGKEDLVSIALALCFAFLILVYPGPIHRFGDSAEYCAMLVSWSENLSPRITADSLAKTERRLGLKTFTEERVAFSRLKERYPALVRNDKEMDLPHFWLYSLAAAVFYWPVRLLSLNIGLSFMLLHLALLTAAFFYVRRKLGPAAGLGLMLVVSFTPLFWFINKTQVEFTTVILAIVGVALFVSENLAASAFVFALSSTQNPPFAILSALVLVSGFVKNKWAVIRDGRLLWLGTFLLAILQPAYYYLSLGVLNPVVAAGGATFEGGLLSPKRMLSFIVDADIGLLANWPVALLLLIAVFVLAARRRLTIQGRTWVFLFLFIAVLLWSQSRTTNFNHGGTYNVSRYAVWYLGFFFLSIWQIYLASFRMARRPRRALAGAGLTVGLLVMAQYWPDRTEQYLRPTSLSRFLYDHIPKIYAPVPEVFIERYRGLEGEPPPEVWAVSNTSGNKILILGDRLTAFREESIPPIDTNPFLDRILVYHEAKKLKADNGRKNYFYIDGKGREFITRPVKER